MNENEKTQNLKQFFNDSAVQEPPLGSTQYPPPEMPRLATADQAAYDRRAALQAASQVVGERGTGDETLALAGRFVAWLGGAEIPERLKKRIEVSEQDVAALTSRVDEAERTAKAYARELDDARSMLAEIRTKVNSPGETLISAVSKMAYENNEYRAALQHIASTMAPGGTVANPMTFASSVADILKSALKNGTQLEANSAEKLRRLLGAHQDERLDQAARRVRNAAEQWQKTCAEDRKKNDEFNAEIRKIVHAKGGVSEEVGFEYHYEPAQPTLDAVKRLATVLSHHLDLDAVQENWDTEYYVDPKEEKGE